MDNHVEFKQMFLTTILLNNQLSRKLLCNGYIITPTQTHFDEVFAEFIFTINFFGLSKNIFMIDVVHFETNYDQ